MWWRSMVKRAVRQKLTAQMVEKLRRKYEGGVDDQDREQPPDPAALLDAIDFCARAGMPMPRWLAEAWCARYEDWMLFRAKSLDEAFGVSRPKGMHIDGAAQRQRLKARVVLEVLRLHGEEKLPIDQDLFDRVGKVLGIGGGLVNKIYYKDNPWRDFLPLFEVIRNPENS